MTTTIINVVSGKGGTGKTLLSCVLADMLGNSPDAKTVVVDLDVFVRGLTSLLYFHREEKLHIVDREKLTVSDFFVRKLFATSYKLGIVKYRSFDVLPAVHRIDQKLNFQDLAPNTKSEAKDILAALIRSLSSDYKFIILDSRAGYDELVAATHQLSTLSICVEEQDQISKVTADNLVSQLGEDDTPIFRLTNKARGVVTVDDFDREARSVKELGVIPFDMDILNNFGTSHFWDTTGRSLYKWALARAWNVLNSKVQLGTSLELPRQSPIMSVKAETVLGFLGAKDRIFFTYGLLIAALSFTYTALGREFWYTLMVDPTRLATSVLGLSGLFIAIGVVLKKPRN